MKEHTHIQFSLMSCGFMFIPFRFNQTFSAHIWKHNGMTGRILYMYAQRAQGSAVLSQVDLLFDMCGKYKCITGCVCVFVKRKKEQKMMCKLKQKSESFNHSFWIGYAIHSKYYCSMLSFFQSNLFSIYVLSPIPSHRCLNKDDMSSIMHTTHIYVEINGWKGGFRIKFNTWVMSNK